MLTSGGSDNAAKPMERRKSGSWRTLLHLACCAVASFLGASVPVQAATDAMAGVPGIWLMRQKVAIQIFDCSGLLCGRAIWLKAPLDPQGLLKRDLLNPDPALRQRQVCGPTVIWNLHPVPPNRWEEGWFYNPDDGVTYRVKMVLTSPDIIEARIYLGIPLLGADRTLIRIPHGIGAGWC